MLAAIFALLLYGPPLSDLDAFPSGWACGQQAERYHEHARRLRWLRGIHGWEGGRWDDWIEESEYYRRSWEHLAAAHECWLLSDESRRQALARYKELIGPAAYLQRWRPPEAPEP